MVIDYDKFPLLKKINLIMKGNNIKLNYEGLDNELLLNTITESSYNMNFLTDSFLDSLGNYSTKLIDSFFKDENEIILKGIFITKKATFILRFSNKKKYDINNCVYFFDNKTSYPIISLSGSEGIISDYFNMDFLPTSEAKEQYSRQIIATACSMALFKKYAPIETKTIFKKTKTIINKEKQLNNTDFNITYLDSNWFTNLIKSEGFSVRGHFRLQPIKKQGQWTKELIWINEFQKEGYTRMAGKTKQL